MNRSILIVICDFLLVSLLAFSSVDINKVTDSASQPTFRMNLSGHRAPAPSPNGQVGNRQDLAAVMRLALNEERKNREQLLAELAEARQNATEQSSQARNREQQLRQHEQQLRQHEQQLRQQLQVREQETLNLQQQQTNLLQQVALARTSIEQLNQQLQTSSTAASKSQAQLLAAREEARKRAEAVAALQQQLTDLNKSNQVVFAEKQQLSTRLQVAQVEKQAATQQVARMTDEVKIVRAEKAKLVEGMQTLATKSSQLARQIRQNQPLAPNTIFNQFVTNRVEARFNAVKKGLFGTDRRRTSETVLVTDGTNTFALCHVEDTPLTLWEPGTDWDGLTGSLSRKWATFPIRSINFSLQDPRVVWMPVTAAEAAQLGCKVYRLCTDPFKFQDAVIVGTQDPYYGECKFEIDLSTPNYVKLDRNFLKGLFGKFNPSRGDLVFSRTGQLMGIMANSTYCLLIRDFEAVASFQFGKDVTSQHTGMILSELHSQIAQYPVKLQ